MSVKAILYGQNYTKTEIDELLDDVQDSLEFDDSPTANSDNPVKSRGIYTALSGKQNTLNFDNQPTNNSLNMLTSGSIYTALRGKQNTLTIASTVSSGNNNPVSSDAVYTAIQGLTPGGGPIPVDSALSETSTNPVQNKVINSALANKANTSDLADYATNSALGQKAPTNHASSATTYGVGTSSNYGHLKITDSISNTAASSGVAISPKAVNELRTTVLGKQDALSSTNVLPIEYGGTGAADLGSLSTGSTRAVTINQSGTALTTRDLKSPVTATALSVDSLALVTEKAIWYGLPYINNDHSYSSASRFYAPTSVGTINQILTSTGSGAPTWTTLPSGGFLSTNADGELVGRGAAANWNPDSPPYAGVFNVNNGSTTTGTLPFPSTTTHTGACAVFEFANMNTWSELYITQRVGGTATPRLFQRSCLNGTTSNWVEYVQRPIDGTIDSSIIPNLNASKITAGTLATSVIPNLNASKITAGTLPVARGGTGVTSFAGNSAIISSSDGSALSTRAITNNTSEASLSSSSNNLITERSVWNALPQINGVSAITYNRSTTIYAPISAGTNGQFLVSKGSGAPDWGSLPSASTSAAGIVKLSSATNSTSTSLAATASAVKTAYDLANGIKSNISNFTCKSFSNKTQITLTSTVDNAIYLLVYQFSDSSLTYTKYIFFSQGIKHQLDSATDNNFVLTFNTSNKKLTTIKFTTASGYVISPTSFTLA